MNKNFFNNLSFFNIIIKNNLKKKFIITIPFYIDKNYLKYNLENLLNIKIIKINNSKIKKNYYLKNIYITYIKI
uniref:50S ribosomal protein L23 n=1 Tax=Nephromyces sp. ex Molgula occidentalis TaxID=2544991 RepID=A0A5C1H871_9APIC|nr:hypothetical protein [Nephromyces sp. ex Molgula occidentalis]